MRIKENWSLPLGIANFVANVGHSLHLPELGISEALGGQNTYTATVDGHQYIGQAKTYNDFINGIKANPYQAPQQASAPSGSGATSGVYSGGGSSSGAVANPNYDFLVDDQLARLPGQEQVGMKNILDSYTAAFQTLMNQKNQVHRDYDTNVATTQQDNVRTKGQIDEGVRGNISALGRLLGAKGAGNSSAATILAPYAAGVLGNSQRADVQNAYGHNMLALDTSIKDADNQFDNSFGELGTDKGNRENALRGNIASTKATLLANKGNPALQSQIADLGRQVDSLGAVQSFTPKAVNYTAPDLSQYNYEAAAPSQNGLQGGEDGSLPGLGAYATLLGLKKKTQSPVGV